jgi:hypothetical protein
VIPREGRHGGKARATRFGFAAGFAAAVRADTQVLVEPFLRKRQSLTDDATKVGSSCRGSHHEPPTEDGGRLASLAQLAQVSVPPHTLHHLRDVLNVAMPPSQPSSATPTNAGTASYKDIGLSQPVRRCANSTTVRVPSTVDRKGTLRDHGGIRHAEERMSTCA